MAPSPVCADAQEEPAVGVGVGEGPTVGVLVGVGVGPVVGVLVGVPLLSMAQAA